jgi:hypothetical protein
MESLNINQWKSLTHSTIRITYSCPFNVPLTAKNKGKLERSPNFLELLFLKHTLFECIFLAIIEIFSYLCNQVQDYNELRTTIYS